MRITFIGHRELIETEDLREKIKTTIIKNINKNIETTFYCGGYGDFDNICAQVCRKIKRDGFRCNIVYVTPYISEAQQQKIKYLTDLKLYDSSLYPSLENIPYRLCIVKRNEWMVNNSDLVIAYVSHSYGGAHRALEFAKQKKKNIINLAPNCRSYAE